MDNTLKLLIILLAFIVIVCLINFLYNNKVNKNNRDNKHKNNSLISGSSNIENFQVFEQNKPIGNLIYIKKNIDSITKLNNFYDIELPDSLKITSVIVDIANSNKDLMDNKYYKLYLTDKSKRQYRDEYLTEDLTNIKNVNSTGLLKFNEVYNDTKMWENSDGNGKYIGRFMRIVIDKDYLENLAEELKINIYIYGIEPSSKKIALYENLSTKTISGTKTNTTYSFNLTDNKLVSKFEIPSIDLTTSESSVIVIGKISYKNSLDDGKATYYVNGVKNNGFIIYNGSINATSDSSASNITNCIYFKEPILANKIIIESPEITSCSNIVIYSNEVNKRDEINFKLRYGNMLEEQDTGNGKCPDIDTMVKRQTQALKICEALETSDRLRNVKNEYGKNKKYLEKIAQQEKELKELEQHITKLIEKKNKRIKNSVGENVYEIDKEMLKLKEIREQSNKLFKSKTRPDELNLKVNLNPDFKDLLLKLK